MHLAYDCKHPQFTNEELTMSIDVRKTAQDAGYVAVGVGVIAYQQAQVRRREIAGRLSDRSTSTRSAVCGTAKKAQDYAKNQAEDAQSFVTATTSDLRSRVEDVSGTVTGRLDEARGTLAEQAETLRTGVESGLAAVVGRTEPVVESVQARLVPLTAQLQTVPETLSKAVDTGRRQVQTRFGLRGLTQDPPRLGPLHRGVESRLDSLRPVITALAGGVGAARFLRGLLQVVPPSSVTAVVNTGDDDWFHGLLVCPDLDTVTYTLAGVEQPELGWGLADETFAAMDALERYGFPTWFRLGDRDLATHLFRTQRQREGATLSTIANEIATSWGIETRLIPMSDEPVRTRITTPGGELAMQEWFVRDRAESSVTAVAFAGAEEARPAPGVLEAIDAADTILVCPSNPVISIGPLLAVPGIRDALIARRDRVVAVSPIIAGKTVKGPADRLMAGLGMEVSCVGVARAYADFCGTIVIDHADAHERAPIAGLDVHAIATDTLMRDARVAAALARDTLDAVA